MTSSADCGAPPRIARTRRTQLRTALAVGVQVGLVVCGLVVCGLVHPAPADAQEIKLSGPLMKAANAETFYVVTAEHVAARRDFHVWLGLGGTPAPEGVAGGFSGVGAQITDGLALTSGLFGFPSEVRWGAWAQMWIDGVGGRAEGGLAAQLYLYARGAHSPVDIRFGGGHGDDALGRVPHLSLTLSGGSRRIEGVPWPGRTDSKGRPMALPQLLAGWRLFLTGRGTVEPDARYWVTGGVELELGVTLRAQPMSRTATLAHGSPRQN